MNNRRPKRNSKNVNAVHGDEEGDPAGEEGEPRILPDRKSLTDGSKRWASLSILPPKSGLLEGGVKVRDHGNHIGFLVTDECWCPEPMRSLTRRRSKVTKKNPHKRNRMSEVYFH